MDKKTISKLLALVLALGILCAATVACSRVQDIDTRASENTASFQNTSTPEPVETTNTGDVSDLSAGLDADSLSASVPAQEEDLGTLPAGELPEEDTSAQDDDFVPGSSVQAFNYAEVPAYSGEPYVLVNENVPFFDPREITMEAFESYSPVDSAGRCGIAWGCLGLELMPQEEREDISEITPSGWNQAQVGSDWLYNRCHLIGFQLTGENARADNLITGTRVLNTEGMLPFENMVADYIKETGNHVMYRATPYFMGDEQVCRGVLLEGRSVEDDGEGVLFCVFAYNVYPGVEINYTDGSSAASAYASQGEEAAGQTEPELTAAPTPEPTPEPTEYVGSAPYIGNSNTGKFHRSTCGEINKMSEKNKVPLYSTAEAVSEGYVACKKCKPM